MCGIAGFIDRQAADRARETLLRMGSAIRHRGPDSDGIWTDDAAGVGLVHRRLAIVELSEAGAQPMLSASGRYVACFNGEIYNHAHLRAELEARFGRQAWRGHSDTETLLASVELLGLEAAVQCWVGMFALALWDRQTRELHLLRDRFGEKPLYWGLQGGRLYFASELKAIRANPAFVPRIDRAAAGAYFRHHYIPAPHSIYEGIQKLKPGHRVTVKADSLDCRVMPYWSPVERAREGLARPFAGTFDEASRRVESLLRESIGLQVQADVPVGAFLSGGIDSSTVVALMQSGTGARVKTFTIGFAEAEFDEARHAAAVARHLGTEHTELLLTPGEVRSLIPEMPFIYDEPFADVSQLPTYAVSKLAREHVTVSLSGDAGDELFGGYTRYARGTRAIDAWTRCGAAGRALGSAVSGSALVGRGPLGEPRSPAPLQFADGLLRPLGRAAELLGQSSPAAVYQSLMSFWRNPGGPLLDAREAPSEFGNPVAWLADATPQEAMQLLDVMTFLPDQILVKVDRAAMRVSLETRVPLLDHRVAEFVWSLPAGFRAHPQASKQILRDILARHVPVALTDRPKMGFGVPIADWLRGPLRDWAEDLLDPSRMAEEGLLDAKRVRAAWGDFLVGGTVSGDHAWGLLAFQAWMRSVRKN